MAKELSQSEVDALLSSLRQAQEEAGAAARAESAPGAADPLGAELTAALVECVTRGWRTSAPTIQVAPAEDPVTGPPTAQPLRVERLGPPLRQRVWFFGDAAASVAVDGLLADLTARLPASWKHQALPVTEPFPEGGLLLPLVGAVEAGRTQLILGLEADGVERLRTGLGVGTSAAVEGGVTATLPIAAGGAALRVDELEVQISVYVGGGVYPLSSLSSLRPGSVLPLGTEIGEPAVIAIAGRVIAFGEVVVTRDDTLAVRLTRLLLGEEGREAGPPWLEHAQRGAGDPERL